jgi:PAS domain S-box-containing protein
MKEFIRKNAVVLAVGVIMLLMILGASLILNNKASMVKNNIIQKESESITMATNDLLYHSLHIIDLGVRIYGFTKKEEMLNDVKRAFHDMDPTFETLEARLAAQSFKGADVKKLHKHYLDYARFNEQMIEKARLDSMEVFKSMLAEDKGTELWKHWYEVSEKIKAFEAEQSLQAVTSYEAAQNNTIYLQLLMLSLGLPTLGFIIFKIKNDDLALRNLLVNLEENNRQYIFNPGTELLANDPKTVIDHSIHRFKEASELIKRIAGGDFEADWNGLTTTNRNLNEDNLAGELLKMRENMKRVREEDEKRLWSTEGLAAFSEIVRNNQDQLEKLAHETLIYLCRYLDVQQGSLFIVSQDEQQNEDYLEMAACYAFNKKKHLQKRINIGEGVVGQAYLEKETTLLSKVPNGYTSVTSGLGEATPTCLIVVPLIYNDQVAGILELAGFQVFADYQIAFLEKAGEFVASAITTVKIAQNMRRILQASQQQAEELKAAEEEMRQNMEELQATQEETDRRGNELERANAEAEVQKQLMVQNIEKLKEKERENEVQAEELRQNLEALASTQTELENSKQKIQAILNKSPMGILVADQQGSISLSNQPLTALTGFTHEELGKHAFHTAFKFLQLGKLREGDKKRTKTIRKDGTSFMTEVYVTTLEASWLLYVRDVSMEVQREQQLGKSMENAEHLRRKAAEHEAELMARISQLEKKESLT